MAKLNIEFMDDKSGFCSKVEDDLEDRIENLLSTQREIGSKIWDSMDREEFEQLFVDREFLFAWYPFRKNSEILEIGGGVGALTGLLCKKARKVISIEKKAKRAEIIQKRYNDIKNLEVIHDNYFNLSYNRKFDYIVIHDIFGYVKKYIKAENPYERFFEHMRNMLKDDGVILLATENRLGVKYFSGAIEDYSNKFFVGVDGFDGYDVIYTPTKRELQVILEKSGLYNYRFYYPFPDNIFPIEIFTDNSLQYICYGGKSEETGWNRFELFNEKEMFETLQREGVVQDFVNAFLVEIGQQNNLAQVDYCKMIDSKNDGSFKKVTITGDVYCDSKGIKHSIAAGSISLQKKLSDLLIKARQTNMSEKHCYQQICVIFKKIKVVLEERGDYYAEIYTEKFIDYFGDARIKKIGICIDLYDIDTKNIFTQNGNYQIFLEENDCKVPIDYLFWTMIYEWYLKNIWGRKSLMKLVDLKKIYQGCKLNKEDIDVYKKWRNHYRKQLNRRHIEVHYVDWYKQDFIYPVDAAINGDLIMNDFFDEERSDDQIMLEKDILDEIR